MQCGVPRRLQVMPLARTLADCVIPAEYGISPQYKLRIGSKIAKELVDKLLLDLENVKAESFSADRDLLSRSLDLAGGGASDGAADVVQGGDDDMQVRCTRVVCACHLQCVCGIGDAREFRKPPRNAARALRQCFCSTSRSAPLGCNRFDLKNNKQTQGRQAAARAGG